MIADTMMIVAATWLVAACASIAFDLMGGEMSIFGECDCCNKRAFLTRIMSKTVGETYACKECCGVDPREWAEDEDEEMRREG